MQELSVADRRTRQGPDQEKLFREILFKDNRARERYKAIEDLKEKVKNVEHDNYGVVDDLLEMEMKDIKEIVNETEQKMVSWV